MSAAKQFTFGDYSKLERRVLLWYVYWQAFEAAKLYQSGEPSPIVFGMRTGRWAERNR